MYFTTKLPLGGLLIRVDVDPVKLADQYGADVCVWADARSALHAINQALTSAGRCGGPRWVAHGARRSRQASL